MYYRFEWLIVVLGGWSTVNDNGERFMCYEPDEVSSSYICKKKKYKWDESHRVHNKA